MTRVPDNAAQVWIVGDTLWLGFTGPTGALHTISFRVNFGLLYQLSSEFHDLRGIVLALDALRSHRKESRIGTKGSPVRHDLEKAMSSDERYRRWIAALELTAKEIEERDAELKELGL